MAHCAHPSEAGEHKEDGASEDVGAKARGERVLDGQLHVWAGVLVGEGTCNQAQTEGVSCVKASVTDRRGGNRRLSPAVHHRQQPHNTDEQAAGL